METLENRDGRPDALSSLLGGRRVLLLSGAGISTESGIPDYRGPQSAGRQRKPILYREFVGSTEMRRRYWARSLVGWPFIERARPNKGHGAVARLEAAGIVTGVLTQNVDGLHQAAGSRDVVELHGSLATVRCLGCRTTLSRQRVQEHMLALNPGFGALSPTLAPDGDADIPQTMIDGFLTPTCERCGGVLKPDVVFFGENVPKERVALAWQMLDAAEILLVVGSSLTVFSGYRFVARAVESRKPVIIINDGPTRGDHDATLRVTGRLGRVLPDLASMLLSSEVGPSKTASAVELPS